MSIYHGFVLFLLALVLSACGSGGSGIQATNTTIFNAHSAVLGPMSSVRTWGYNGFGQIGDDTTINRNTPFTIATATLSGVSDVAVGADHTVVVARGKVWCWGYNGYGQLGDGSTGSQQKPKLIDVGDANILVKAVAAGASHTLALKTDGTVWGWGYNGLGQLGDGTNTNRVTPVKIPSLANVTAIAAGGSHSLALKSDGTVWAWGNNNNGQLGDGSTLYHIVPQQIAGLSGVTQIAAGGSTSAALRDDLTNNIVWVWGYNYFGQVGDGTNIDKSVPTVVVGLPAIGSITCALDHILALDKSGALWSWGYNFYGQLGDGTTINRNSPISVTNFSSGTSVIAFGHHSLAKKSDGTLWSWGYNKFGQLGNATNIDSSIPVVVSGF